MTASVFTEFVQADERQGFRFGPLDEVVCAFGRVDDDDPIAFEQRFGDDDLACG